MPTISESKLHKIFELKNQGYNIAQISRKLHASRNTVKGYLRGKLYKNPNVAYPVQQQPQVAKIVEAEVIGPTAIAAPQPFQQRETPFRLPRELDEEDVYLSTREYTIGGRPVDEFLGREPSPASATYLGPPAPPGYPRFIPVPERRIEPENDVRRDEDRGRREKSETASLIPQLIQKRQQEKPNADIKRLDRRVDRVIRYREDDAKIKKEYQALILQQQYERELQQQPAPVERKPVPVPEPEVASQPEIQLTFQELKNRLTGDILGDSKFYNDYASHLNIHDRGKLFTEHIRLSHGGEKEEGEDEEEYE